MNRMSNQQMESNRPEGNEAFPRWVILVLCIAQTLLIMLVMGIVIENHLSHRSFLRSMSGSMPEYVDQEMFSRCDSVSLTSAQFEQMVRQSYDSAFEYIGNEMVGLESQINESNSFTSILLAIITLCVTLAVVIPYVVGKAIAEEKISSTARVLVGKEIELLEQRNEENLDEIKQTIEEKYNHAISRCDEDLDKLFWAEGHTSRMISYLLRYKTGKGNPLTECGWAIGWSAKAMIRYFRLEDKDRFHSQKFVEQCQACIIDSKEQIKKLDVSLIKDAKKVEETKAIVLRAFIDLFDVFQFHKSQSNASFLLIDEKGLMEVLRVIYAKLSEFDKDYINTVKEALLKKAKHKEYYSNTLAFENYAHQWLVNNGVCDNEWRVIV